jgi:large repetitive protein
VKNKLLYLILGITFFLTLCIPSTAFASGLEKNFTNDSDFDNGIMVGLEYNSTHDQLQLSNKSQSSFSFIWVPNSNEGTVSKVNTVTGQEIARYRTGPQNNGNPSRTTVDLEGNCWLGNRQTGTAVKIGLLENGGYIDRNHNGIIETSGDLNGDGVITGSEILPWGQDECVLWEVILIPGLEGNYTPGEYTGSYVNDNNYPGPRGVAVDSQNNVWLGCYGTGKYYYVNGTTGQILKMVDVSSLSHTPYGAIIDQNGILWSSGAGGNNILRLDPSNNTFTRINIGHFAYGLGLDKNNHLFVAGWDSSRFTRINILTGTIEWTKPCPYQSRGVAVTDDDDVWIVNSAAGTLTRYSNNGDFKATIPIGNTPTGVSTDRNGNLWVVDYGDEYIHRVDPLINKVDLSKALPGTRHYGYSDMTGTVSQSITTKKGTWIVTHDSEIPDTPWGPINWNSYEPNGTKITVRVKSSNDGINWSPWETVTNNTPLQNTPPGRYLMVETTLQRFQGNISPILYDLTVKALVADVSIEIIGDNSVIAGKMQTLQVNIQNHGPQTSHNNIFIADIPLKTPEYSPDNGATWNNWIGTLNLGNLDKNGFETFLIRGLVPSWANGTLQFTGRVFSDTPDINLTNNIYHHFTVADTECDLSVGVTDYPDPATPGEQLIYQVTVQNAGPSTASGVYLTGTFPLQNPEYSLDGGSNWNLWTGSMDLGTMQSNTSKTVLFRGLIPSSATDILNCTVQVESSTTDTNQTNNICNQPTTLKNVSNLSVTMTEIPEAVAGDIITSTITVSNDGPSDAHNVIVSFESILESLEQLINGNWLPLVGLLGLGTIPAGENRSVHVRGTIPSSLEGALNIVVLVNGTNSTDTSVLLISNSTQFQVNMETPASAQAGDDLTFKVNVRNPGHSTPEKVILTGTLPLINPQFSLDNGVTWNPWRGMVELGQIGVNDSVQIIFHGKIPSSLNGTLDLTTSILIPGRDPQKLTGTPIGLEKIADLKITLTINNPHPHLEEDFQVKIRVENQGPSNSSQTRVEYELPPGMEIIGNRIYDGQGNMWILGDIPPGGIVTLLLKARSHSLSILQPVAVAYGMEYDPDLFNNRASSSLLAYLVPSNYIIPSVNAASTSAVSGQNKDHKTVPMQETGVPFNFTSFLIFVVFMGVSLRNNRYARNKKLFFITTLFLALAASGAAFADTPPDTANLTPETVKSGDVILIEANPTPSTTKVKVYLQDETYDMVKESDNIWRYKFVTPQVADGNYPALITAWNTSGGQKQFQLNYTIDNTPPLMEAAPNTIQVRSGDKITIKVESDPDTALIQALFRGEPLNLAKQTDGTWNLEYTIPDSTPDGLYTLIITGHDNLGNTATNYLPLTIDNTPTTSPSASTLTGKITPDISRSGQNITIEAFTGPETTTLDAMIIGVAYQLIQQADGTWKLIYTLPDASDGTYPVLLTATDNNSIQKNTTLSLTIDNTPPQVDAILTPELVRTGNIITITATTSSDAEKVTASILGETLKLKKQSPNTWMLRYAAPQATDGLHNILITTTDKAGNQAQTTLTFTVDNTPPTLNPTINQTLVKSGDKITITTTADTDTESIKAYIQDDTYELTKNPNCTWSLEYTTPQISDGVYSILLIARDLTGNTNQSPLTFTVDNTPPVINPEINPESVKPGENITITVTASSDTQNVVAIIGTQRITLNYSNGTWTANYTIPLAATFDIHTIQIEGTDTMGNVGKNTASYEVLDPNPIPPWLNDLINPDTTGPTYPPDLTTNTGPGNKGGSNKPGPGTIGGNDQLYRDQMYIRDTLTYTPTTNPNTNTDTTTPPPEMPGWEIDTSIFDSLILAACMVASGLIGEELAKREFGGPYGKTTIKDLMKKGPVTPERIMIASFIATLLSPPTLKAEILMVTGLLVYFFTANGFTMAGKTNAYTILSLILFITSLAILVSSLRKDVEKALKESVLGQIFELIKKFFN